MQGNGDGDWTSKSRGSCQLAWVCVGEGELKSIRGRNQGGYFASAVA